MKSWEKLVIVLAAFALIAVLFIVKGEEGADKALKYVLGILGALGFIAGGGGTLLRSIRNKRRFVPLFLVPILLVGCNRIKLSLYSRESCIVIEPREVSAEARVAVASENPAAAPPVWLAYIKDWLTLLAFKQDIEASENIAGKAIQHGSGARIKKRSGLLFLTLDNDKQADKP